MIISGKIVKNTFSFIISDPEVVFPLCFKCYDPEMMFSNVCPFLFKRSYEYEFPWQPNRRYTSNSF